MLKKLLAVVFLLAGAQIAHAQGPFYPVIATALIKGTTLPAKCSVGQVFFKTNASAGSNIYGCTAANTWTAQAGGGGGGNCTVAGASGVLQKNNGSSGCAASSITDNGTTISTPENITVAQATPAVSGTNQDSPVLQLTGNGWSGSASFTQGHQIQNLSQAGTNGANVLQISPIGAGPSFLVYTGTSFSFNGGFGTNTGSFQATQTVFLMGGSGYTIQANSAANYFSASADTGFSRCPATAACWAAGSGANGATDGVFVATNLRTVPVAVASLPVCAAGTAGYAAAVTDSNAVSFTAGIGTVVAAGGTTKVPVYCDGTNWRIG